MSGPPELNLLPLVSDTPTGAGDTITGLWMDARVRVGIDVTDTTEVREAMRRYGDRYEARLFTDAERAEATGVPAVRAASLAARFAAKEAVLKVLADGDPPPWRSIEVRRPAGKSPQLHLHGDAARLAAEAGLANWSVSLTHEGDVAAAVVAAMVIGNPKSDTGTNNVETR